MKIGIRGQVGKIAKRGFFSYSSIVNELLKRITIDPRVMTGRPCLRGMRLTAANVLRLLSAGHSHERILKAYPDLEGADINACLAFAARQCG